MAISDALFRGSSPPVELALYRLAMLLHQVPDTIREMNMEDVDGMLHLLKCDQHKQTEEQRVSQGKANMT